VKLILYKKSVAPYVPSQSIVVERMLKIANVKPNDTVIDLGCGDGRILISAIRDFKAKKAIGYELNPELFSKTIKEIENLGYEKRIQIFNKDLFDADLSEATVITLYLTTSGNRLLRPKLKKETVKGTRIVSHDFDIQPWRASKKSEFLGHTIYLFIIPEAYSKIERSDEVAWHRRLSWINPRRFQQYT
jgi:tRNA A58 N-methylase Trm61